MDEKEKGRYRWRCRRGMLELDLILRPFFDNYFETLSKSLQQDFIYLLGEEDTNLFAWLMGHQKVEDPKLIAIITEIRSKTS